MWTQEQVKDLTTEKVIEEHLGLFQIKEHYEKQNLYLFKEKIETWFGLIKIILNCITAESMANIASSKT